MIVLMRQLAVLIRLNHHTPDAHDELLCATAQVKVGHSAVQICTGCLPMFLL